MLPHPLVLPLRILPDAIHTEVFARAFNHFLRGQSLTTRLAEMEGKTIGIHVRDAACRLHFLIQGGRLRPSNTSQADVRISGSAEDFWLLASRSEDPDTLFFSRRLNIEGDTATGVHIKNLLDALDYDWEAHFQDVLGKSLGRFLFPLFQRTFLPRQNDYRPPGSS